jgi:hypothetical protein
MTDIQVIEKVECDICHDDIEAEEAYPVLVSTFVCSPQFYPECLWEWNNENHVREWDD